MLSLNRVFLMGNLTRDPELRYTPNGTAVASFGVAVNRRFSTKEGDKREEVDFFEVEVWGKQAENCNEYLGKGRGILLEGRLKQDRWEDETGNKRSKVRIVASSVNFMPKRLDEEGLSEQEEIVSNDNQQDPNLPF